MGNCQKRRHDLTKDETQAYLNEMNGIKLDSQQLKAIAGGICWDDCSCNFDIAPRRKPCNNYYF